MQRRTQHARSPIAALALVLACTAPACHRTSPVTEDSRGAALMRNLVRARAVDVFVEAGALEDLCQRRASSYAPSASAIAPLGRDRLDYRVNPPAGGERAAAARIVVGTLAMPRARALAARVGLINGELPSGSGFQWQEQVFAEAGDSFIATFEDAERPGLPVTVFCGNGPAAVAAVTGDLSPAWRPWLQCFRGGELVLSGPLWNDGEIVVHKLERLAVRTYAMTLGATPLPSSFPDFVGTAWPGVEPERAEAYVQSAARARARIAELAATGALAPVVLSLYAHPEQLVARVGNERLGGVNPITFAAHALCAAGVPDDAGAAVAEACALQTLGSPVDDWLLSGAAVDAADSYFGVDLARWVAWIATSGRVETLREIVEPSWSVDRSPHRIVPLRAALFRFVRAQRGASFVRQLWNGTQDLDLDLLEPEFRRFVAELAAPYASGFTARREAPIPRPAPRAFTKAVGIEESRRALDTGFGSAKFEASLDLVSGLGVNAVSLTSYLVDEPDPPEFAGFRNRRSYGPVGGDLGLFCALWQARQRGLATWITPHLLSAPAGSFRGSWLRENRAAFDEFFARYGSFVEHYALLGQLTGAEVVSLGSQIPETTQATAEGRRSDPATIEWKRAGWKSVIRAARGVYSGRLTYSASTASEASKIDFWSDLDAIGYDILTTPERRHRAGPMAAMREFSENLERELGELDSLCATNDRPLLVTQVGFDDEPTRSRRTLAGLGASAVDVRYLEYNLLLRALHGSTRPARMEGVAVWRWSTDPDDDGAHGRDFLFHGLPAEDVVRQIFAGL